MMTTPTDNVSDGRPSATTGPGRVAPGAAGQVRRIGCVSTSRADAGIYRPLLRALAGSGRWEVICLAGGTHHSAAFGRTVEGFEGLSGVGLVSVDHWVEGDGPTEVSATVGRAVSGFSEAFGRADVDLVFVLGDRPEMLGAALAATIHSLPIAHLHGGDVTEGAYDDSCRHAMTKLAHVHFPALRAHADRIRLMGEEAWRIHSVGALAMDGLRTFTAESIDTLGAGIGLDFSRPTVVVAYYPETLSGMPPDAQVAEVVGALEGLDANVLVIGPNADVGYAAVERALRGFVSGRRGAVLTASLSQDRFWSCLARARVLLGNSSAGILEASSFGLPVVNVGDRQAGRVRAANVIDTPLDRVSIAAGIERAMSDGFRAGLDGVVNPYGDGRTAERIVSVLSGLPEREVLLRKRWSGPEPG